MAELKVNVNVDVKNAGKLDSLGGKMSTVGKNLTLGLTLPLIGAGTAAAALAVDAQKAGAKVENAFEGMEAAAWTTLEALDADAQALADLSSFDDDEIKNAQAVLLSFGEVTGEAFDRGTQAAVDLAEFLGTDLQSATLQVGKALNDPVKGLTALGRAGIQFTDEQKAMIKGMVEMGDVTGAQNLILAEMERQFGGTAAAIAATDAGGAAQAFEELAEAGESIGMLLLPVLSTLAGWLGSLATWFQGLSPEIKGFITVIASLVAAIGPLLFIGGKVISSFGAIGAAFKALSLILLANPFVALAAAVIAIVALIVLNWDKIVAFLKAAWDKISAAVTTVWNAITSYLKDVWDRISGGFKTLANILEGVWNGIKQVVSAVWDAIVGTIKGAINGVIGVINGFIRFINGIQIHIPAVGVGPFQTPAFDWWGLGIPQIPFLAEGGIINRATLAVIGESGPEAVVPLNRESSGIMGETHYHVHLTVEGNLVAETPEEVVEVLRRATPFLDGWAENGLALSGG